MSKCSRCGGGGYVTVYASGMLDRHRVLHHRPCRCPEGRRWEVLMGSWLGRSRTEDAREIRAARRKEGKDASQGKVQ